MAFAYKKQIVASIGVLALGFGLSMAFARDARADGADQQNYDFTKPAEGYEGRTPTGVGYCSYRNVPKRECKTVNGKKKCKVVGYTLEQFCQGRY